MNETTLTILTAGFLGSVIGFYAGMAVIGEAAHVPGHYLNDLEYKIDTLIHIHKNDTTYEYKFVKISDYE